MARTKNRTTGREVILRIDDKPHMKLKMLATLKNQTMRETTSRILNDYLDNCDELNELIKKFNTEA